MSLCAVAKTQCSQRNKVKTFKQNKNKLQTEKKIILQTACLTKDHMFPVYMKHVFYATMYIYIYLFLLNSKKANN